MLVCFFEMTKELVRYLFILSIPVSGTTQNNCDVFFEFFRDFGVRKKRNAINQSCQFLEFISQSFFSVPHAFFLPTIAGTHARTRTYTRLSINRNATNLSCQFLEFIGQSFFRFNTFSSCRQQQAPTHAHELTRV